MVLVLAPRVFLRVLQVRALASHKCGLGSIPARCHMWVEFFVGSHPCSEGFFPGSLVFLPLKKLTIQISIRPG